MSSRMRRRTSKVAASSPSMSCGAVVAAPGLASSRIFRILAIGLSNSEIGFAYMRLLHEVGGQSLCHDPPLFQHIGAVGDAERLHDILLDQQHRHAAVAHMGNDVE